MPRVVILGGGFGGLHAAQALRHVNVQVTLIDRRNHHLFQPLLYQLATAALNPSDTATPTRRLLRHPRTARVVLLEAGPRILPAYVPELADKAAARLRRMGCEVQVGTAVTAVDADGVIAGGQRTRSHCVLWAAGVLPSPIARSLGVPL